MPEYRINFGNGQVSRTYESLALCMAECAYLGDGENTRIQQYVGEGEWSSCYLTEKQKRPHLFK